MVSVDPAFTRIMLDLKPCTDTVYHNGELKSLTRYRFGKVNERAKLKQSVSRLVCILFPELEKLVSSLHTASVYALLTESSKGRCGRNTAVEIRDAARRSIGSTMPAKSLELRHTIRDPGTGRRN